MLFWIVGKLLSASGSSVAIHRNRACEILKKLSITSARRDHKFHHSALLSLIGRSDWHHSLLHSKPLLFDMGQIGLRLVLLDCAGRLILNLLLLKDQHGQIVFTATLLLVLLVIIPSVEIVARSNDAYHIRIELFSFRDTQRRSSQTTSLRMLLRFSLQTFKHPNVSRHLMSWHCLLFQLLGVDAILFLERLLCEA